MANGGNYLGKDGNFYRTLNERTAADRRYTQQEEIISQLKRQNDLLQGIDRPAEYYNVDRSELGETIAFILFFPFIALAKYFINKKNKNRVIVEDDTETQEVKTVNEDEMIRIHLDKELPEDKEINKE